MKFYSSAHRRNSDVHKGLAHYYKDIAPSSNIGNSDVLNGPAHYYEDIAPSSNIGNSNVHNGPAHYYEDIGFSSNIALHIYDRFQMLKTLWSPFLLFSNNAAITSLFSNQPSADDIKSQISLKFIMFSELSTIQGSDKEHLEAKPQLWKLVYRSASGYRNALPSWITRLFVIKQNKCLHRRFLTVVKGSTATATLNNYHQCCGLCHGFVKVRNQSLCEVSRPHISKFNF
ncbi:hypothetical protein MAR_016440 [Mya arenaria]|uniref:Uncharacterized protein n=1 Tax=Mya arenaria TaxID=6604 RepID=A0ABY7FTC4_MYAAR|nr:hypothetical protein MAR_016440 [Mya arenaria]